MQKAGTRLDTDLYNLALRGAFMNKDFSVSSRGMLYTTGLGEATDNITLHILNNIFLQLQVVSTDQNYHDNGSGYEVPLQWDNIKDMNGDDITYTTTITYHSIGNYRVTATEFTLTSSWDVLVFLSGTNIDIQWAKHLNLHFITRFSRSFEYEPAILGFPTPDIITPANQVINNVSDISRSLIMSTQYLNEASWHTQEIYAFGEPERLIFAVASGSQVQIVWTPSDAGYLKVLISGTETNVIGTSPTLTPYYSTTNFDYYEGYIFGEGEHEFNFKTPAGLQMQVERLVILQHAKDENLNFSRPIDFPITNKVINDFVTVANRNYYTRPVSLNRFIASNDLEYQDQHIVTSYFVVGLFNTCKFFTFDDMSCWES